MSVESASAPASGILNGVLNLGPPPYWTSADLSGARHGFFGRRGGVSGGIYSSLNVGSGSQDVPEDVAANRTRVAQAMGGANLISVHQVHSARAVVVDGPWPGDRPEADAMVTRTPGLVLAILTADCAPVLMVDSEAGVIGAAHAGWKGAHGGVLEATVTEMCALGAVPERIRAVIGPTIARPAYEVGPEFHARFTPDERSRFFTHGAGDRFHFDLPAYCVARLQRAGLIHVAALGLDTYSLPDALFSHRRSVHEKLGDYGRNCAAIALS